MNISTHATFITQPIDEDLAEQAHHGHGIPSQDPDPAAQFSLKPEDAKREAHSVLVGGGVMAGAATGAAIGVVTAGPVGVVVGATLGAVVGALGGSVAGAAASPDASSSADTAPVPASECEATLRNGLHLKTFVLSPEMLTFSGVFYPTGYVVAMFRDVLQAQQAAYELVSGGFDEEDIMLLLAETILREIGPASGDADVGLPSVGTEGATAQKYVQLAREGQYGLMMRAESDKDTERVMLVVRTLPFSYAQKYHSLAIEDLK